MSLGINEILLVIGWFIGVYLGCRSRIDRSSISRLFFLLAIQVPIIEESLFRVTLHSYISDWTYSREINAFLFGLFHLTNYGFIKSKIVFYQVVMTINLGYYLSGVNNFIYTTLIHSCYNISAMLAMYAYSKYAEMYIDKDEIPELLFPYPMKRLRRSKSVSKEDAQDYEYVVYKTKNKLVEESIAKFDDANVKNARVLFVSLNENLKGPGYTLIGKAENC